MLRSQATGGDGGVLIVGGGSLAFVGSLAQLLEGFVAPLSPTDSHLASPAMLQTKGHNFLSLNRV